MKIEIISNEISGVYSIYGTRINQDGSVDFLIFDYGLDWVWVPSDKCKAIN
jgi:hypothetical protein